MSYPLVMLVGQGRAGKDTAGAAIATELGGVTIGLADPIKRFVSAAFGLRSAQLWGAEKELEFERAMPWVEDCWRALSLALHSWKSPAELSRLPIERWLQGLPMKTTPRHIMQTFGTDCVRAQWPDFWIEHGLWVCDLLLSGGWVYDRELGLAGGAPPHASVAVITDGRFRNELLPVMRRNGVVLQIVRPEAQAGLSDAAKTHTSETEQVSIPKGWFHDVIHNDGSLGWFKSEAVRVARERLAQS